MKSCFLTTFPKRPGLSLPSEGSGEDLGLRVFWGRGGNSWVPSGVSQCTLCFTELPAAGAGGGSPLGHHVEEKKKKARFCQKKTLKIINKKSPIPPRGGTESRRCEPSSQAAGRRQRGDGFWGWEIGERNKNNKKLIKIKFYKRYLSRRRG